MRSNFPENFSSFQCLVRVIPGHHTVKFSGHYVLRHAENQPGVTIAGEGQNKLLIGVLNKRLISYMGAGLSVTSEEL